MNLDEIDLTSRQPIVKVGHKTTMGGLFLRNIIVDLYIKSIERIKNVKNSSEIENFFGPSRVHFPFHLPSPSEKEMEVEGEASVKMADFRDFLEILNFDSRSYRYVLELFWSHFWVIFKHIFDRKK